MKSTTQNRCFPESEHEVREEVWDFTQKLDLFEMDSLPAVIKKATPEQASLEIFKIRRELDAIWKGAHLESKFKKLHSAWKATCPPVSSVEKIAMNSAYQQIIGMGPDAVPLILREFEKVPDHWSWALRAISGENPIQPSSRGKLSAIAADWVAWAKARGIRW